MQQTFDVKVRLQNNKCGLFLNILESIKTKQTFKLQDVKINTGCHN